MNAQDYAKVNESDPCEFAVVLTTGGATYTSGFDTAASVLRSIVTEWGRATGAIRPRPSSVVPVDHGITVCDSRDGSGPWTMCLLNPANVACVTDLRPQP